jgi:hypothetical protein
MKLKPLSSERYTIWELLEFLDGKEDQWNEIRDHAMNGNIQVLGQIEGTERNSPWLVVPPSEIDETDFLQLTVTTEEAGRFKREYCLQSATAEDKTPLFEMYQQLSEQLKDSGLDDKSIAKELKRIYPKILPSRIGRLLPANPGACITSDAHRKRGERLLE